MVAGVILILLGCFFLYTAFLGEVSAFLLILGILCLIIGIIMVKFSAKGVKRSIEALNPQSVEDKFQQWISISTLGEYNIKSKDDLQFLYTANKYYAIKPEIMKFVYLDYSVLYSAPNTIKKIDLNNVNKISLKTNNKVVGEITKENAIGRAVVGGLLFGGVGAIVGGATAKEKQTQTNKITSIEMEIITNDVNNPYSTITLYQEKDESQTNFVKMENAINNLYWSLQNCLATKTLSVEKDYKQANSIDESKRLYEEGTLNEAEDKETTTPQLVDTTKLQKKVENPNESPANNKSEDDLLVLGHLYKEGLITKEEFQIEKEKLLSKS